MEDSLDVAFLARRCQEETAKFYQNLASIPTYCLQLWRRALHGANQHEQGAAWNYVYTQYTPLLLKWCRDFNQKRNVKLRSIESEDFVQTVWSKLISENQKKPLRVDDLREILAYLRTCLTREILMELRRHGRYLFESLEPSLPLPAPVVMEEQVATRDEALKLWERLCACASKIPSQRAIDILAMNLRWLQGYTPTQIVARFPDIFPDEKTVSMILARIKANHKRRFGLDFDAF